MNFELSGGPILEPILGIAISSVILIFMTIYLIKKAVKSNFYQNEFYEFSDFKKIVFIILVLSILISALILAFFFVFYNRNFSFKH